MKNRQGAEGCPRGQGAIRPLAILPAGGQFISPERYPYHRKPAHENTRTRAHRTAFRRHRGRQPEGVCVSVEALDLALVWCCSGSQNNGQLEELHFVSSGHLDSKANVGEIVTTRAR